LAGTMRATTMGRAKQVADRIRAEIPIVDVLYDYGYHVHPDGGDREQQFSCDLHGDGSDTKPSARVYPDSASFHCFACGRSRDAITLVREREGLDFWPAVKLLEAKYGLPPLPWSGPDEDEEARRKETAQHKVAEALSHDDSQSADQVLARIGRLVDSCCRERSVDPDQCAAWWEAHDKLVYALDQGNTPNAVVREAALRVLASVRAYMGVGPAA